MINLRLFRSVFLFTTLVLTLAGNGYCANLLTNGNLEMGNTTGWQVFNPDSQPITWGITHDAAKVHGGTSALSLTAFGGQSSTLLLYAETGNVLGGLPSGTLVRTRIYVKTNNLTFNSPTHNVGFVIANVLKPIVVVWDKYGNVISYNADNGFFQWTNPYTLIDTLSELPPGASKVSIQLALSSGIKTGKSTSMTPALRS